MPAVHPKLPSIWNGGWASNMLGYVPPRCFTSPTTRKVSGESVSWSVMSFMAWSPSSSRAQKHTFQPIDHPVLTSPRCSSDVRAAAKSSGVRYGDIWLPG